MKTGMFCWRFAKGENEGKRICLFPHPSQQHHLFDRHRRFNKEREKNKKDRMHKGVSFQFLKDTFLFVCMIMAYIEKKNKNCNRLLIAILKMNFIGFTFLYFFSNN